MSEIEKKPKKEKKKNPRRAYLDDFKLQENGEYAYEGALYVYQGDWQKCRKQLWSLCAALGVLTIAAGVVPSGGMMNTFYVILPYVGEFTAAVFFFYAVLRLTSRDEKIREYIYTKTFDRFNGYFLFLFIFSVMCLLGEAVHMIFARPLERVWFSLLFIALQVLIFGIVSGLNRHVQAMHFEKVKEK